VLPGQRLSNHRYEIARALGAGGMGQVLLAHPVGPALQLGEARSIYTALGFNGLLRRIRGA
jgi:hypothetical protein